jgi:hypothetical protein
LKEEKKEETKNSKWPWKLNLKHRNIITWIKQAGLDKTQKVYP